ncbi:undecaprenyldiphospho-muramoylpentapeptide beta-N-acetylglucosaminyltransferase [Alterisphingorhabdus coralli]|uniref:UDP-N-acetylglucosamine--N-acetylmuramyl-(pentapeptide) pyrophosphoryl-undecaprenol N-acetylglucosamine transferase n=1 Tax=Alterisphingorhabdus coralli TaxID=3071408 RepID=A0AA97FCL9_9SPHN|nr:undecaprenyldiphospho-muramoylpentapeptide beta-N-acetylglucosaminyltransferase [Parasphingorhabdus sp. SCSIO 66989]WOE76600.1 undecaprenyldiphospho-muramoylpentapeptide beta-N-acetylglucosaminyltransferase [Parasphingorhabdus sp. SCSIO 66989]
MIPAYSLGEELMKRGHRVALLTDERGAKIPGIFEEGQVHILPTGRLSGGPLAKLKGLRSIWTARKMALELIKTFQPTAVVGFGGYPALPTLLAAHRSKLPTIVHEQNAVFGRVNRLMARKVGAIATAYKKVERLDSKYAHKVHVVGNPVRQAILDIRTQDFPPFLPDGIFRVLVTGGSQGASILSDVVPDGLAMLPTHLRRRLQVTQQCREEDIDKVRERYAAHEIPAELATYLNDLPDRLAWSHLFIGRAGASTIAELTVAGRPAILVPLPIATDNHQTFNVKDMVEAGGARSIQQPQFTAKELAKQIQKMAMDPASLENAALAAHKCGYPNATQDLADLVESAGGDPLTDTIRIRPSEQGLATAKESLARTSDQKESV